MSPADLQHAESAADTDACPMCGNVLLFNIRLECAHCGEDLAALLLPHVSPPAARTPEKQASPLAHLLVGLLISGLGGTLLALALYLMSETKNGTDNAVSYLVGLFGLVITAFGLTMVFFAYRLAKPGA